jgi:hypothetical protein
MKAPDFVPLGTVLSVKGNPKTLMVIARGLALRYEGTTQYYDYGACLYPEGMIGEEMIYFNHEVIENVVHKGFSDEMDEAMVAQIAAALEDSLLVKADPKPYRIPTVPA